MPPGASLCAFRGYAPCGSARKLRSHMPCNWCRWCLSAMPKPDTLFVVSTLLCGRGRTCCTTRSSPHSAAASSFDACPKLQPKNTLRVARRAISRPLPSRRGPPWCTSVFASKARDAQCPGCDSARNGTRIVRLDAPGRQICDVVLRGISKHDVSRQRAFHEHHGGGGDESGGRERGQKRAQSLGGVLSIGLGSHSLWGSAPPP